jgi:hypothetical protein
MPSQIAMHVFDGSDRVETSAVLSVQPTVSPLLWTDPIFIIRAVDCTFRGPGSDVGQHGITWPKPAANLQFQSRDHALADDRVLCKYLDQMFRSEYAVAVYTSQQT